MALALALVSVIFVPIAMLIDPRLSLATTALYVLARPRLVWCVTAEVEQVGALADIASARSLLLREVGKAVLDQHTLAQTFATRSVLTSRNSRCCRSSSPAIAPAALLVCALACSACEGSAHSPIDAAVASQPAEERTPDPHAQNAILIVVDGLRLDVVDPERTPELARLARSGVGFRSRSAATGCASSVASLLTSLDAERHHASEGTVVTEAAWTLPEALRCEGFDTALFAANGFVSNNFGLDRGFEHRINYVRQGRDVGIEAVTDDAVRWIAEPGRSRFFVYVHVNEAIGLRTPHAPFDPGPPPGVAVDEAARWLQEVRRGERRASPAQRAWARALYEANVRLVDAALGRFIARLDGLGLDGSTLIVVTSDHGVTERRGVPDFHFDDPELLAVPLIFRGPGVPPPSSAIVPARDVAPTVVEALGLSIPARFEGRSLGPRRLAAPGGTPTIAYPRIEWEITRELCEQLSRLSYNGPIDCTARMREQEERRRPERELLPFTPCR